MSSRQFPHSRHLNDHHGRLHFEGVDLQAIADAAVAPAKVEPQITDAVTAEKPKAAPKAEKPKPAPKADPAKNTRTQ